MGTQTRKNGGAGAPAETDDIIFIDGERIEIASTHPDVESAIEALHRGD